MKYIEALIILLNYNSKDIVFYSLGILVNALNDEELKYCNLNFRFIKNKYIK